MGIKLFNRGALTDFQNVIGRNGLNSDIGEGVVMLEKMHQAFYSFLFHLRKLMGKSFWALLVYVANNTGRVFYKPLIVIVFLLYLCGFYFCYRIRHFFCICHLYVVILSMWSDLSVAVSASI